MQLGKVTEGHGNPVEEPCHRPDCEHIICFLEPHFHYEEEGRVGEHHKNTFSSTSQGCQEGIRWTANIWKVVGFFFFFFLSHAISIKFHVKITMVPLCRKRRPLLPFGTLAPH